MQGRHFGHVELKRLERVPLHSTSSKRIVTVIFLHLATFTKTSCITGRPSVDLDLAVALRKTRSQPWLKNSPAGT